MKIQLNGEEREIENDLTIDSLLKQFHLQVKGVAIELNHQVILPHEWQFVSIREGDAIEIVQFVGGGI
ncbi:MAG: thiamine biosynthesis protein ThiS [Candidatus Omnitrophica bacterium CG11_big_fil_rev_8_21_14_0_20_45_26]|uniref:Thiamine biosynthesis protein ThiS n=1 Tax=Candidatus Abzuiibacterium crystallinum TaxID=1974748 RepID=A0A2H0LML1_9BACT|nr:MAG: thiamine biosynthesis protein ThiS [Candidatus Omnitrophica bacterium CG11_big_fil_rev_8_21_14_0_20_45_26]PIW65168.1 MAG: thiamine biosynthesis protein ThiS [Candidatus Omnitrophica bacterium CG12_big_fil_rev_8_21_14_0_65_45_16]